MANPTIGRVRCPLTGEWAEVRRYKTGKKKLYFVGPAGMITPNLGPGQEWILANAEIWGEDGKPETPVNESAAVKAPETPVNGVKPAPPPEKPVKQRKSLWEQLMSEDE